VQVEDQALTERVVLDVVAVVVENVGYGGTYAAPIAREVLRVALARQRT